MNKVVVHRIDSVSEYFLNLKNEILEKRYLTNNKDREYHFKKEDPSYQSLIKLFHSQKETTYRVSKKERTINEYRQNKDVIYLK
jgi:hypothetical protein